MLSRFEAHSMLDMARSRQEGRIGLHKVMDEVYASIGTCGECKYSEPMVANRFCSRFQKSNPSDWFCADYKPK
jgi:hypothetical protein